MKTHTCLNAPHMWDAFLLTNNRIKSVVEYGPSKDNVMVQKTWKHVPPAQHSRNTKWKIVLQSMLKPCFNKQTQAILAFLKTCSNVCDFGTTCCKQVVNRLPNLYFKVFKQLRLKWQRVLQFYSGRSKQGTLRNWSVCTDVARLI